jgi:hypothetical protein
LGAETLVNSLIFLELRTVQFAEKQAFTQESVSKSWSYHSVQSGGF